MRTLASIRPGDLGSTGDEGAYSRGPAIWQHAARSFFRRVRIPTVNRLGKTQKQNRCFQGSTYRARAPSSVRGAKGAKSPGRRPPHRRTCLSALRCWSSSWRCPCAPDTRIPYQHNGLLSSTGWDFGRLKEFNGDNMLGSGGGCPDRMAVTLGRGLGIVQILCK